VSEDFVLHEMIIRWANKAINKYCFHVSYEL